MQAALAQQLPPAGTGEGPPASTSAPATKTPGPDAPNNAAPRTQVYATRVSRSFTFLYHLQRGGIHGSGQLEWKRTGEGYEARLKGTVGGIPVLSWASSGRLDTAGIAPAVYTERRLGKAERVANFQRSESKITFPGSDSEFPLVAGAQDRLSWMVQLPAILAADPAKAATGARLAMFVVGTRGHAETWVFQFSGREAVKTAAGTVASVKWARELRKPQDTQVEVWLDPARQYLPVRVRLNSSPFDSPLDLTLADAGS
jgi:hypothetical protein